jgi:serine/threonine protein kinase/class 3 adenylate cyclase
MQFGPYRLLAQLDAGRDGASYRAADAAGNPAEVRVLSGAVADADRWKALSKRLRLAATFDHPATVRIQALELDHDPPFVALDWVEGNSLAESFAQTVPPPAEGLRIAEELCGVVAEAHRLGLVHGRLRPASICLTDAGGLKLDFSGVEAGALTEPAALAEMSAACVAPEVEAGGKADAAADLYSLGMILYWLLRGGTALPGHTPREIAGNIQQETRTFRVSWQHLVPLLLASDPAERPPARTVLERLQKDGSDVEASPEAQTVLGQTVQPESRATAPMPTRVGRFRLMEKLGEGGMGSVYRAEDTTDGTIAAVKLLQGRWNNLEGAWQRLRKEARMLAEVNNPYVANLIEINEHEGVPYLVMEFVEGESLSKTLARRKRLPEVEAVAVMADVARALVEAHRRGIVHRDVKPENILLQMENEKHNTDALFPIRVKLCDFGLARHVLQSESLNLTQAGTAVGTPFYASPEQCAGARIDARTDVYAMGATLYHLLAGRPPFVAETALGLSFLHANKPPPPLREFNPEVSDGVCRIVEKALAKHPDDRQADAEALLLELERLRRGEAVSVVVHPRLPPAAAGKVLLYEWTWELEAAPEQLWPHVANTERLNRAIGLPAVDFTTEPDPSGGTRRFGEARKAGVVNAWREHPFEWVEGRRLGVLREYHRGVFKWLASTVELKPREDGGTTLTHRLRIEPRGLLGRLIAAVEVGVKGKRALERVYRRIDGYAGGKLGRPETSDPFEPAPPMKPAGRRRLERLLNRLIELRLDPGVVEKFGDFLSHAPPQEVARIRPLALAERLGLDADQLTAACLHGAREGLLVLLWDILCPICRIPSSVKDALKAVSEHEHCPACDLDFKPDFGEAVEMIFRVHPEVRPSELATYCVGGPAHSPHVAAQVRVAPGETIELELQLSEGAYRLRGPQLPYALDFQIRTAAPARRWDLTLGQGEPPRTPAALQAGRQILTLTNEHPVEVVVRVERTASRADALTAVRASTLSLFRELFPGEALSPGRLASVASLTLLVTDLDPAGRLYEKFGDARAFDVLHGYLQAVGESVKRDGGAVVKAVGEGILASFIDPAAAVRVGLVLAGRAISGAESGLRPRVAVHRGPVMVATINDHLDYFGSTVSQASRLTQHSRGGEMVLTQSVASDPEVADVLRLQGLLIEVLPEEASSSLAGFLHRITVPARFPVE